MNVSEAIFGRRAVRSYTEQEVPRDKILKILHAAVQAPSAVNQQPWAFAVFQGKQRLKSYSDDAKKESLKGLDFSQPGSSRMDEHLTDPSFNMFYNAGTLIVILAKSEGANPAGDCWMAAQNLMLAAYEHGFGTCPIGLAWPWLHLPETKGRLGIPANLTAIAPLIIGYAAEKPEHPPRVEPDVVVWLSNE